MGEIIQLAEHAQRRVAAASIDPLASLTRTPALAIAMAVLEALPTDARIKALLTLSEIGRRNAGCEASSQAAAIAKALLGRERVP